MNGFYVLLFVLIVEGAIGLWVMWPDRKPRQRVTPNAERLQKRAERRRAEIRQAAPEVRP